MVKLAHMHDAQAYSPVTTLAEDFEAKGTFVDFTVTDASIFSDLPLPNIITLMYEDKAESITVTKIVGNTLSGARHHDSETLWKKDTSVARVFTALDYERFKENITRLNDGKVDAKEGHSLISAEEQLTVKNYSTRTPLNISMLDSTKGTGRYLVAPDISASLFDGPMVADVYSSVSREPDSSGGVVQELRGLQDPTGEVLYRVFIDGSWTDWKEASNNKLQQEVDKKADKEETQKQLENKIERVNNMSGKYVTLYGNFIDTEWGSNLSITDAIDKKADKSELDKKADKEIRDSKTNKKYYLDINDNRVFLREVR